MKQVLTSGVLAATVLAAHVSAHHSFAAEYDGSQPVTVTGTVAKVEWTNPHIHFFVAVKGAADGKPDLSGVWITGALSLLIGDKEARAIADADRAAGRVLPPPEALSYKPDAETRRQYYLSRRGIDDPMARCFLSGVPRITTRP